MELNYFLLYIILKLYYAMSLAFLGPNFAILM
jgi:hypothetical protein